MFAAFATAVHLAMSRAMIARSSRRRVEPGKEADLDVRAARLGERRQIGPGWVALRRRHREALDLAPLEWADPGRRVHDGHGHLPRDDRSHRVATALVGDVHEPGPG